MVISLHYRTACLIDEVIHSAAKKDTGSVTVLQSEPDGLIIGIEEQGALRRSRSAGTQHDAAVPKSRQMKEPLEPVSPRER
jgi:hypothetical protein